MLKYNQLISIKKDNKIYSGILLDKSLKKLALSKLTENKEIKCWVIGENDLEEKSFYGITFIKDDQFLYGPDFKGKSLLEILNKPGNKPEKLLIKLVESLILLRNKLGISTEIQSNSVYFLENGKILIISDDIFKKIKDISSQEYNLNTYSILNHPYLIDCEEHVSFTIGIILYKILTDTFIYNGKSEDEINSKIRNLEIIEPNLYQPKLKKEISDYLYNFFNRKNYTSVKLENWLKLLKNWEKQGYFVEVPVNEIDTKKNTLILKQSASLKKYNSKVFWEKNGKTIFITLTASLLSLILILYFLLNYFKPRSTKGYKPIEVVEAYYNSFNTLQHNVMEDCIINKADKGAIREVLTLFVANRQTMAYKNISYIIPAYTWDKQGRPPLNAPYFLYGIINLKIESINGENNPVFIADYEKWHTQIIDNQDPMKPSTRLIKGTKIKEKLFLKNKNNYWLIYKIDLIDQKELQ